MERINMEDARNRVEFRKNETGEVIKIVEFEDIPEELQLPDSLPNETIDLCKYFYTGDDEYFKEAFFYWLDNYHYKLLDSDILDLIDRAKYEKELMYDYFEIDGHIFKQ